MKRLFGVLSESGLDRTIALLRILLHNSLHKVFAGVAKCPSFAVVPPFTFASGFRAAIGALNRV
jgi:hypothetical protein